MAGVSALGPHWVRLRSDALSASCPVYPDQQTSMGAGGRSQKVQKQTWETSIRRALLWRGPRIAARPRCSLSRVIQRAVSLRLGSILRPTKNEHFAARAVDLRRGRKRGLVS